MPGPIQPNLQANLGNLSVLIVEEERVSREASKQVAEQLGSMVAAAENFTAAMHYLSIHAVDLLLLQTSQSASETQDMVSAIKAVQPQTDIIVASRTPNQLQTVRGVSQLLPKPINGEELMGVLHRAAARRSERPAKRIDSDSPVGSDMIGQSPEMRRLYRIIQRTASSKHPILILGEEGTGKTKLARMIHASGALRDRPFVVVDCASATPSLLENHLFGSASIQGTEQPALASGGTVLLDAVGELPLTIQGKLFRALQEKEFRNPSGKAVPVDARVIAASVRDLDTAVHQGNFRRDLYLRLNVVALRLPPLRERREDIAALAQQFLQNLGQEKGAQYSLGPDAMKTILTYDWPGNVRELKDALHHAVAAAGGPVLSHVHLPPEIRESGTKAAPASSDSRRILPLAEVERKAILETLHQLNGNKQMAAQVLGIGKTTLYRKLKEYGINQRPLDGQPRP